MANAKASLQEAFAPQVEALVKKSLSEDYEDLEDGLEEAATITTINTKKLEKMLSALVDKDGDGLMEEHELETLILTLKKLPRLITALANKDGSDERGSWDAAAELRDIPKDWVDRLPRAKQKMFKPAYDAMSDISEAGDEMDVDLAKSGYKKLDAALKSLALNENQFENESEIDEEVDETTLEEILAELDELDSDDLKEDDEDIDPLMEAEEDEEESEEEEDEDAEEMPEEDEIGADDEEIVLTFGQLKAALAPFIGGEAGEEDADVDVDLDEILGEDDDSEEAHAAEMEEAKETIEELRSTLNEVNLLNAKLLYMNKVFKAKTLTESQKVKVVSAFDRANSVKEVKNVYTTLSESLATPKKVIKESYNAFASKPSGFNVKQNITEMDPFIKRMQTLAGIK
jgi:hypothetical protein